MYKSRLPASFHLVVAQWMEDCYCTNYGNMRAPSR